VVSSCRHPHPHRSSSCQSAAAVDAAAGLCAVDRLREDHADHDGGVQQDTDVGHLGRGESHSVVGTEGAAGSTHQVDAVAVPVEGHLDGIG